MPVGKMGSLSRENKGCHGEGGRQGKKFLLLHVCLDMVYSAAWGGGERVLCLLSILCQAMRHVLGIQGWLGASVSQVPLTLMGEETEAKHFNEI